MIEIDDKEILSARLGDEEAMGRVFEAYKNFVYIKARNYFLVGADKDDLIQEGMIGLFKAIKAYDSEKAASFNTFATICIKRQIITAIKMASTPKHELLNSAVSIDFENDETNRENGYDYDRGFESYISYNPEEIFFSNDQVSKMNAFLNDNLSKLELEVYGFLIKGFTYKEIAVKLDEKPKTIDNAIQRIKKKK